MIHFLIHFLNSPLFQFADGGSLSWGWALAIAACWMLIPGAYLLRAAELRNRRKVFARTQPAIDQGLADLRAKVAEAEARAPDSHEARFLRGTLQALSPETEAKDAA